MADKKKCLDQWQQETLPINDNLAKIVMRLFFGVILFKIPAMSVNTIFHITASQRAHWNPLMQKKNQIDFPQEIISTFAMQIFSSVLNMF